METLTSTDQLLDLEIGTRAKIKLRAGNKRYPVEVRRHGKRLILEFPYNMKLLAVVKSMDQAKWHGFPDAQPPQGKWWSIALNERNMFQLEYLMGGNPYARYDLKLVDIDIPDRKLGDKIITPYDHQKEGVQHILTRRHCVLGYEMGTGKTLAAIIAIELFEDILRKEDPSFTGYKHDDVYYVAPRSALAACELDFAKWDTPIKPIFVTYEGMKKIVQEWHGGKAPRVVIFDESSRLKNPTSQRSKAARDLADGMRSDHGWQSLIVEMSGSPAPKSPCDWWHQCEVARPGFLKEGNIRAFERRLALVVTKTKIDGGTYPERIAWLDDAKKCMKCGKPREDLQHDYFKHHDAHDYKASVNEVAHLYKRMNGLVDIRFKKDCLDLPEKRYIETEIKPTLEIMRLARIIQKKSTSAIQALTLLRELSDGFQYVDEEVGVVPCDACKATGEQVEWFDPENPDVGVNPYDIAILEGTVDFPYGYDDDDQLIYFVEAGVHIHESQLMEWRNKKAATLAERLQQRQVACFTCNGDKQVPQYKRAAKQIKCGKEDVMRDRLDELQDIGRYVIYAGFFGSVDRCVDICKTQDWHVIRADGRGWTTFDPDGKIIKGNPLVMFQEKQIQFPRLAFVGQPDAAGMGLTLTASPKTTYYSNTFNAEGRIQSEDRIHRIGMDVNLGATIEDLIHLPSDRLVLENLRKKRKLQSMTMGDMVAALESIKIEGGVREYEWDAT